MTIEQMSALIQGIYDKIFDAATKAEPGGKPIMNSAKTMLTLMKPGLAINPNDFESVSVKLRFAKKISNGFFWKI